MRRLDKNRIKDALSEIADESYQAVAWTGANPSIMSSLTEALCSLYDDSGLGDVLDDPDDVAFTAEIDLAIELLLPQAQAIEPWVPTEHNSADIESVRKSAGSVLFAIVRHEADSIWADSAVDSKSNRPS